MIPHKQLMVLMLTVSSTTDTLMQCFDLDVQVLVLAWAEDRTVLNPNLPKQQMVILSCCNHMLYLLHEIEEYWRRIELTTCTVMLVSRSHHEAKIQLIKIASCMMSANQFLKHYYQKWCNPLNPLSAHHDNILE